VSDKRKTATPHRLLGGGYNDKNITSSRNTSVKDGGYNPKKIIIDRTEGQGEVTRVTYYPHNDTTVIEKRKSKENL
jgi:hypothetical protein